MTPHITEPEKTRALQGPSSTPPLIAAPAVWDSLTPTQQQGVYQELVRICQQVLAREARDERHK
jgi:hypothetical protein